MLSLPASGPCTSVFPGAGARSCSAAPVPIGLGNRRACMCGAIGRPRRNCYGPLLRHQRALLLDQRRDLLELLAARKPPAAMLGATPRVGAEHGLEPVGHFNAKQVPLCGGLHAGGLGRDRLILRRKSCEVFFKRASQFREPGIEADLLLGRRPRFSHGDLCWNCLANFRGRACQKCVIHSLCRQRGHVPTVRHTVGDACRRSSACSRAVSS
jgi:hypothetical protein